MEKKHIHKRLFQLICPLTYASILAHFCKELSAKVIHVDKPNIPLFSSLLAFFDGFWANAWCFLLFSFGQCLFKQVFDDFVCDKQGAQMSKIVLFG